MVTSTVDPFLVSSISYPGVDAGFDSLELSAGTMNGVVGKDALEIKKLSPFPDLTLFGALLAEVAWTVPTCAFVGVIMVSRVGEGC